MEGITILQSSIDDFYNSIQTSMIIKDKKENLKCIYSRTTTENISFIKEVCDEIKEVCNSCKIPLQIKGFHEEESCIKMFKYFVCNTKFDCQSLIEDDVANGFLVGMQPPFSSYLFIEIIWSLNIEEILAESVLHLPLDLTVEILKVIPRSTNVLDFNRSLNILSCLIHNIYKKAIILKDIGTQSKNINANFQSLLDIEQELILQFSHDNFMRFEDLPKKLDRYKRVGIILKKIMQIITLCLECKISKKPCFSDKLHKIYRITFGHKPFEKLGTQVADKFFENIDKELISLLLKKVKEIDCNIYISWTEFEDDENSFLTLQKAIGLASYRLIEIINNSGVISDQCTHLIQCLNSIKCEPEPNEATIPQLCLKIEREENVDYLINLFKRYKEWDDFDIVEKVVISNKKLLSKKECSTLIEFFKTEVSDSERKLDDKLLNYFKCLKAALKILSVLDIYEIVIESILNEKKVQSNMN